MEILSSAPAVLVAYLMGSIPTGYLVARLFGNVNLLAKGSRRTGATNVLRTMGWRAAGPVFAGDFAKGALAIGAARLLTQGAPAADLLAGLAAMAGHNYSLFLGFRGGRGVTTGLGTLVVIAPGAMAISALVAGTTIAASRYVSLGSIVGAASLPLILLAMTLRLGQPSLHLLYVLLGSAFIIASHRDNIGRLLKGTERKLGERAGP